MATIDPLRMEAWRLFLEAHKRVLGLLEAELEAECDLPLAWYDVLVQLSEVERGRRRMQDLARAVLLSKSGLTRLVDRMATAGLVARESCEEDRRGQFVVLTPSGRQRLRDAAPAHVAGVNRYFTGKLTTPQAAALRDALTAIMVDQRPGAGEGSTRPD